MPKGNPLVYHKMALLQLSTKSFSMHRFRIASKLIKHSSNVLPYMVISFIKTSIIRSTISLKMLNMHIWNVAGALHKPKDILPYV